MQKNRQVYVVLELPDPVASLVTEARRVFHPYIAKYPAEITVAGSSGIGTIRADQQDNQAFAALEAVAASTRPFEVRFGAIQRFEGTDLYYFPPVDRRPFDDLHQQVAHCGIGFYDSPFPFNPHCTISGVDLSESQRSEIVSLRIDQPFIIERLMVCSDPLPIETHFTCALTG